MHNNFNELIVAHRNCCTKNKVAKENGKRFEIISNDDFTKIRIDGCLISTQETEKCDFGFIRHSNNEFYFVELKGKEIQKAFDQIANTINHFQKHFISIPKDKKFGFIVSSSVPKAGIGANTLKQTFAKKFGKILEIKNKDYKHIPK